MDFLKQLKQRKADTLARMDSIFGAASAANRDLTEEERKEYDTLKASVKTMNEDIARAEAQLEEQRTSANVVRVEVGENRETKRPWTSLQEQLKAIKDHATSRGAKTDPRLYAAALGGNESVDAEGGFLVAPQFAPDVWQRSYDASQIAKRCFDQPMSSNRLLINAVDEDSRVDGSRWGGLLSYWVGEASTFTPSQPKFRQMELVAKKLIVLSYATDEQLVDGPAWAKYVDKTVPLEIAFRLDDAVVNGSGAGMPLGYLNSGALIAVTRATGGQVSAADIFAMWARRFRAVTGDLVWLINQDVEDQLWNLTRGSGTAVELLYTGPGQRGNNTGYGVMMGKPVIPVEQAATLGTLGDITLVSLEQYCLARRSEIEADTSIHVQFLTDQQAFRWKMRCDGQPFWKKPLTPKNGTNTQSAFIGLHA